jgi:phytoene/squalene synthetase
MRWRRTASRKTTSCERRFDARYVSLMKELVARTRQLFAEGMPLAAASIPRLRVDIEMFSRGGLAVLDAIEAIGYNTLEHRPSIPKSKQSRCCCARSFRACSHSRNILKLLLPQPLHGCRL